MLGSSQAPEGNHLPSSVLQVGGHLAQVRSALPHTPHMLCSNLPYNTERHLSADTLTASSSLCVSSSIRRMSSIVRSIHLSIQQKSWRWKLVNILFSCLEDKKSQDESNAVHGVARRKGPSHRTSCSGRWPCTARPPLPEGCSGKLTF